MRPTTDLHRALARTTVGVHRRIELRRNETHEYHDTEREQQFQHGFSGYIGDTPPETTFRQLFDIVFVGDAGVARDSQLDEPIVRFGFRLSAPKGTVPYAYVQEWVCDDDLNYIGAKITIGVTSPLGVVGSYRGVLHSTFQGFGSHIEDDSAAVGDVPAG